MKTCLLILIVSFLSFAAYGAEPAKEQITPKYKIQILEAYFAENLTDLALIGEVIPKKWIYSKEDRETAKEIVEAELVELKSSGSTDTELSKLKALQLRWLNLLEEERADLNRSIESKNVINRQKQLILKNSSEIEVQEIASAKVLNDLNKKLSESQSQRDKQVILQRIEFETLLSDLNKAKQSVTLVSQKFTSFVEEWNKQEASITALLEDNSASINISSLTSIRAALSQRIEESNSKVNSQKSFYEYYFSSKKNALIDYGETKTFIKRDTDTETIVSYIEEIQSLKVSLMTSAELLEADKRALFKEIVFWHRDYREHLFSLRGELLKLTPADKIELFKSKDLILLEWQTLLSNVFYWMWSRDLVNNYVNESKDSQWAWITSILKALKSTLFLSLIFYLFYRRKKILNLFKLNFSKLFPRYSSKRWFGWIFEIVDDLYIFFLVLFLGNISVDLLISFGFNAASLLRPYLRTILIFFLVWGFIDLLKNLISQRRGRSRNLEEVVAMEKTFELVPKLWLTYWLVERTITISLTQALNYSLIEFFLLKSLVPLFAILVFVRIWFQRSYWRLVSRNSTGNSLWSKVLDKSNSKVWEPIVLVISGGFGVYLLAWTVAKKQLGELKFAKSFQAMVSRALLERNKSKKLVRVVKDRFPSGYIDLFQLEHTPTEQQYVQRVELDQSLVDIFKGWKEGRKGSKVLISGDRGIGKTTFIQQFLQKNDINCKHIELLQTDTSIPAIDNQLRNHLQVDKEGNIADQVLGLEPQVIVLENLENTILREVDGFEAFKHLLNFILETSKKHLWITTVTPFAWSIGKSAVPGADCFTRRIHLEGFNEREIEKLIINRHEDFGNHQLDFGELSFDSKPDKSMTELEMQSKYRRLFFRILWDYTEGNPRQALYFWRTSLSCPKENKMSVKLFDIPEQDTLGNLRDRTLMALAAIVEHNGMTLENLSSVMNENVDSVERMIEELTPNGILYSHESNSKKTTSWHLESFWMRTAERYLEKRQLLFRGGLK